MNEFNMTSRLLYQDLRDEAKTMAMAASNPTWIAAYESLRNACDVLDAMYARSSIKTPDTET